MAELTFRLRIDAGNATGELRQVETAADATKKSVESPTTLRVDASTALASIRDITVAVGGALAAVKGLATGINALLDAELSQRRAMTLAAVAFGDSAKEMAAFASEMQSVTNFGDEEMLSMFAKMSQTFKLSTDEIKQLTPYLLDFTEATAATGMTMESAFDLMGRALNGHTEMLGRHGIELDKDRLAMEGVSYLVEKLGEDYGGTATALADLRTQNRNMWGDVQEDVGGMLAQVFNPLLKGIKAIMEAFNSLSPVVKGVVAGLVMAVPVIATVATAIVAVTAAVVALKTAINPVVGIISLVTGAVVAGSVAYGSYAASAGDTVEAQHNLNSELSLAEEEVTKAANKFSILSSRLLELKSKTALAADEKREMSGIINTMNTNYGEYLNNINLEKLAYDDLAITLTNVNNAMLQRTIADKYGKVYDEALSDLADAQMKLDNYNITYGAAYRVLESQLYLNVPGRGKVERVIDDPGLAAALRAHMDQYESDINALTAEVNRAQVRVKEAQTALNKAMSNVPEFKVPNNGSGDGGGGGAGSPARTAAATVDAELAEFDRMIKSLQAASQDAFERHDAEYARRLELIAKYTKSESDERKQALILLHEWDTAETQKIFADERAAMQKAFEEKIAYYANLNELGVNSYDQLKAATDEYYEWAKLNLPEQERELVLAQLRQTNLRWGQHRQEQIDKEEAHQEELADIRDEFAGRGLELDNNTYALQLRALDNYYKKHKQKLIEAGLTEEQITAQHQKAILKLNLDAAGQVLGGVSSILGDLASAMDQENATQFKIWKGLAIAQAIVDTLAGANAAYKAMATIPVAGPGLAVAAAAAALAAGYLNVKKISATEYKPTAATGGYLIGAPHAAGGTVIEAEGGEYIIRKDRVSTLGKSFFDFLNSASLTTVRAAFSGFSLPHLPMPAYAGSFAASGGYVSGSNPNSALIDEIRALRDAILGARPTINVSVDPLSSDPVKISEIAERGSRIRSRF